MEVVILFSSAKICNLSKTEDLNVEVFDMITGINESGTSKKHISYNCEGKLTVQNVIQSKNGTKINVNVNS